MLSGVTQQVLFELYSLDVAVRASETWTQAAQFLAHLSALVVLTSTCMLMVIYCDRLSCKVYKCIMAQKVLAEGCIISTVFMSVGTGK